MTSTLFVLFSYKNMCCSLVIMSKQNVFSEGNDKLIGMSAVAKDCFQNQFIFDLINCLVITFQSRFPRALGDSKSQLNDIRHYHKL